MLPQKIMQQFRKPVGNMGRVVGWLMSIKNTGRSVWIIHKLNLSPSDHILEVDFKKMKPVTCIPVSGESK